MFPLPAFVFFGRRVPWESVATQADLQSSLFDPVQALNLFHIDYFSWTLLITNDLI